MQEEIEQIAIVQPPELATSFVEPPQQENQQPTVEEKEKEKEVVEQTVESPASTDQRKVGSYNWRKYNVSEQPDVNYLADFFKEHEGAKLLRRRLGLNDEAGEERARRAAPEPHSFNSSNARILGIADDILNRMTNFGGLDEERNVIRRKRHNNDNYYEQDDDFINDDTEGCRIQQFKARFDDFFAFEGPKDSFISSPFYQGRLTELNIHGPTKKIKKAIKRSKLPEKANGVQKSGKSKKQTDAAGKKPRKNTGEKRQAPKAGGLSNYFKTTHIAPSKEEKTNTLGADLNSDSIHVAHDFRENNDTVLTENSNSGPLPKNAEESITIVEQNLPAVFSGGNEGGENISP